MSTAPSRPIRGRIELALLLVAALAACGVAQARQSDKNQPIHVDANSFAGSQSSGKIRFTGDVKMNQGSFHADGATATGYTDPNDTSQWQRLVLTGSPAHFRQTQDNGALVHGQAQKLDYLVSKNTVILTGNASVVQQGRGKFHGEKLVYNTDTGAIEGTAATGGRVHITLEPRSKPASTDTHKQRRRPKLGRRHHHARSKPAPAHTPAPKPMTPPATSAPAPAATAGMH